MPDTRRLADYHCHCDYSIDATGSIDEYCLAAIRRGLTEVCFTTHYDSNPDSRGKVNFIRVRGDKRPTTPESLAFYVEDVRHAHDKYYPLGLSVKLGVEFGWYAGCEENVRRLSEQFAFDYILCGIHELDNLCFCSRANFEQCFSLYQVDEITERYAAQVIRAAESGLFNTIAHLDYIKKYGARFYGPLLGEAFANHLPEIFAALRLSGTALEINTAGVRNGPGDYYPSAEIITRARGAGVDVTYLGSDAHCPEHVGFDFEAASLLQSDSVGVCGGVVRGA